MANENFEISIPDDLNHELNHDDYTSQIFASIIQKMMFDQYYQDGRVSAPAGFETKFQEHLGKHLFFITFDYRQLDGYDCEPRVAEFLSAGLYYDLLVEKVQELIRADPDVEEANLPDLYLAFYGILFGQNRPLSFKRKFWDAGAFDMALLVHPEMMPYFERYVEKFNKLQHGVLFQFTKSSPFRQLKMTRYNPEVDNLHDIIEERVSLMAVDDFEPLFEESYTYLQDDQHEGSTLDDVADPDSRLEFPDTLH
jgi:hypothetical protein